MKRTRRLIVGGQRIAKKKLERAKTRRHEWTDMSFKWICLVVGVSLVPLWGASAATLIVDAEGGADFVDIQAAIDAAEDGDTVLVSPGSYMPPVEGIDLQGKAIALTSSEGPEVTIIDAAGLYYCLVMVSAEGPSTTVSGFAFTGAYSSAVYLEGTSPVLRDLHFVDNNAGSLGYGGAGLYSTGGSPVLEDVLFERNSSPGYGGAIWVEGGELTLRRVDIQDSRSDSAGGGIAVSGDASLTAVNLLMASNSSAYGGGVYCSSGSVSLTNATLVGNAATEMGGALMASGCDGVVTSTIVAFNRAGYGGVLGVEDWEVETTYSFYYNDLYQNGPRPFAGIALEEDSENLEADPGFVRYVDDLKTDGDDLHLLPGSLARDAGFPDAAFNDPDGSRADLGAYGGPLSDRSYEVDEDGDGMADGWEQANGLNPSIDDSSSDPDGDGVTNLEEYARGLSAQASDTDRDNIGDAEEIGNGSDPRDPFNPETTTTVPSDRFASIQAALEEARDGVEIRVLAGTYKETLDYLGKNVAVRAIDGPEMTRLSGEGVRPVVLFLYGEAAGASLEGFSVTQGYSSRYGGGIWVSHSSPHLADLWISTNHAYLGGGGLGAYNAELELQGLVFEANTSDFYGAAAYFDASSIVLRDLTVTENVAASNGGAMRFLDSSVLVERCVFERNTTYSDGGAIASEGGSIEVRESHFEQNTAGSGGGALDLKDVSATVIQSVIVGGSAGYYGGAINIEEVAGVSLLQVLISGASASSGGAVAQDAGTTLEIEHGTIVGGFATGGGGAFYNSAGELSLHNSVVAYNLAATGGGFKGVSMFEEDIEYPPVLVLEHSDIYGNRGEDYDGFDLSGLSDTVVSLVPEFVSFIDDLDPSNDDLHLRPGSPLIDAADPASDPDPDGTRADIGYYGGPDADFSYYADQDQDGMWDGYEQSAGLDDSLDDSGEDPDGDGLTNLEESLIYSDPFSIDTDGDGMSDAEEETAGGDPTHPFSPLGYVVVPETIDSIQEAINLAREGDEVRVSAGIYKENLDLLGKQVSLVSLDGAGSTVIDGGAIGSVIRMIFGEGPGARVSGFTLTNGAATYGGGIYLNNASPTLESLVITASSATSHGGGIASFDGSPTLTDLEVFSNSTGERGNGGGLYVNGGSPTIARSSFAGNTAASGGGVYLYDATASLTTSLIAGNEALYGGGVSIEYAQTPSLANLTIHGNTAAGGAGIFCESSSIRVVGTLVTGNRAPVGSGLLVRGETSEVDMSYSDVWGNQGENFGGEDDEDPTGENGNLSEDPLYQDYTSDGVWSNDDLHLQPDSPAKNGGDPSISNPDGSRSDMGHYGGPDADRSYYADQDGDGMFDGWEAQVGLDAGADDASEDPDGDTVSNELEFQHGTDPLAVDTDGDGYPDPDELEAGSDPTDFFSPDDTVVVTEHFATIQQALNAARDGVTLLLEEGTYVGLLDFGGKQVVLKGVGAPERTILDGGGQGPVVFFRYGEQEGTRLEGVTVMNGVAPDGGGVRIVESSPSLDRLIVRDNEAINSGGGISIVNGSPRITSSVILNNIAAEGAGIAGRSAYPVLIGMTIAGNDATGSGGGFSCIDQCVPSIQNSIVAHNNAGRGGGINLVAPMGFSLEYNDVFENTLEDYSGSIGNQTGRNGNVSVDPAFVSWGDEEAEPDLHLQESSPVIDQGGVVSKSEAMFDLDGIPRPSDGTGDGTATFDMGAYELELDLDGDGLLASEGDCLEYDPLGYPGAEETCDDEVDQDCDGEDLSCEAVDDDGDGYSEEEGDCDDEDPSLSPGAAEVLNEVDDDCDGEVDEGLATPTNTPPEQVGDDDDSGGCACTTASQGAGAGLGSVFWLLGVFLLMGLGGRRRPCPSFHAPHLL